MPTLIEIGADLSALEQLLEEAAEASPGGELNDDQAAAFDAWFAELEHDRDRKLDSYAALIREWTLRAAARREELERLQLRVRVDEGQAARLKQRLKEWLEANGLKKIETRRYKLTVCRNGGKTPLDTSMANVAELPEDLRRVVVTPDNDKIRERLEAGGDVPGCRLLPRETHLRIA